MKSKSQNQPFAKKSFGQNFLTDPNFITKIVSALNPQPGEKIVEIGAGRGALTERLVESGAYVFAVELDKDLIPLLQDKFGSAQNFRLIEGDALKVDFRQIATDKGQRAKLVANLPYYISTAILQKLIEQREVFSEMILMFQREVIERITARPGEAERGFLTVLAEAYLETKKLFDVPPSAFRPAPKVWSAVARFVPKLDSVVEDETTFRQLAGAGFAQRRKTILNNLKNAPPVLKKKIPDAEKLLENAEIDPKRRAETLSLDEWKRILSNLI